MNYLLDNFTGNIATPNTSFNLDVDGHILVTSYKAMGSSLTSYSSINNSDLWKDNVVELFLDLGDKDFYYEFEVAPNGATFTAKKYPSHLEYLPNDIIDSYVSINGNTYEVELRIDLTKFPKFDSIKYNAFRIERGKLLQALSPTHSDTFHVREKFITLKLA